MQPRSYRPRPRLAGRGRLLAFVRGRVGVVGNAAFWSAAIQSEGGIVLRSGDLDRHDGAGVFALEERIDRLQEKRFHSGCGLRELGLQLQLSVKIDRFAVQVVRSVQIDS